MTMKIFTKYLFLTLILCWGAKTSQAQDDLMNLLDEGTQETTDYTFATFKATRTWKV